ncbi:hypothetical protein BKA83DRAFT_133564 [Pisolithus microcarpus]|nr:hypothetical protein BKA83DRAFT_133564 [Pisolithus microcarpus]
MDPSAPQTVGKRPAICGITAGLYGTLGGHPPARLALFSAVNGGLAAATFFSIREYIVVPVLTLTQDHYYSQKGIEETEPTLSWIHIRTSHLLDSAVSGGITGGILNTWKRGKVGLVPGLGTGALLCTLLQWGMNELHIFRIRHVYRTTTMSLPAVGDERTESHGAIAYLSAFGRRISDDDYLKRLKTERETYLRRMEELERDLHEKPR